MKIFISYSSKDLKEALINSTNGMKCEVHGTQQPRHFNLIGEGVSTAQRSHSLLQSINQCFLKKEQNNNYFLEKLSTSIAMAGFKVFYDKSLFEDQGLYPGDDYHKKLKDIINKCDGCIFLIGENFFKPGSYTLTELRYVKEKWSDPSNKVLPIIFPGGVADKDGYLSSVHNIFVGEGNVVADIRDAVEIFWKRQLHNPQENLSFITIENYDIPPRNEPYFALNHFGPNDSKYFKGRQNFVHKLLARISKQKKQFTVVLGASGAGKSSVVLAGLVPKLYEECIEGNYGERRWKFTYIRPGENDLLAELAKAMIPFCDFITQSEKRITTEELINIFQGKNSETKSEFIFQKILETYENNNFLIIVDQFEELYRTESENVKSKNSVSFSESKDHFIKLLVGGIEAANSLHRRNRFVLIATMQETENAIQTGFFAEKFGDCFETLGPINLQDLDQVIDVPGVKIGEGIIDDIKKKFVGKENKISLPLLQYFLWNLWRINKGSITYRVYKDSKGIEETLADAANDAWISLIGNGEKNCDIKKLFLGLVKVSFQGGFTLRARSRAELGEISWRIAEYLAKETRLIVIYKNNNCEVAEIAHEILITNWLISTEWFKDYIENLQLIDKIEERARIWYKQRRSVLKRLFFGRAHLFRGDELNKAINYSSKPDPLLPELSDEAKVFVNTGKYHKWIVMSLSILFPLAVIGIPIYVLQAKLEVEKVQHKEEAENRLSEGGKVFFETYFEKRHAAYLYKENNDQAYKVFDTAFNKVEKNDPEGLIYLNNAKVTTQGKDSLVIAVSVPIQKNPAIANEILRGVAMIQDEINSSIVSCDTQISKDSPCVPSLSKPLRVIIASDDNDKRVATNLADYLVNEKKEVLAVIGHNASDVSQEASKKYQGQLLMLSPTSFALKHDEIGKFNGKNFIYSLAAGIDVLVSQIVEHMSKEVKKDKPHVLICYDSRAVDQDLIAESFHTYNKENKNKISIAPIECHFDKPAQSIDEILGYAKDLHVTHLFLGPHVNTMKDAFYLARENPGFKLYASPTLFTNITLENGKDVEGLIFGSYWHPNLETKESLSFVKNFKDRNWKDSDITWRTALAYDAARVIVDGLQKIPDDKKLTHVQLREKLRDEVIKLRKSGVTGKIVFNEKNGRREEQSIHLMRVSKDPVNAGYKFELIKN